MRETEGGSALTGETTPALDLVFELLSNERRRYVLYYLHEQPDGVATIETLAEYVASLERSTELGGANEESTGPIDTVSERESTGRGERVRLELTHVHLPKLEDAGVIEHDQRSETVRYWSQPSLEEWLEHAQHKEIK